MEDKELLELAAKAAGRDICWDGDVAVLNDFHPGHDECSAWYPLSNDGDALRLAVKLGITVYLHPSWVYSATRGRDYHTRFEEAHGSDAYSATRLAIVRAAAEIGKAML